MLKTKTKINMSEVIVILTFNFSQLRFQVSRQKANDKELNSQECKNQVSENMKQRIYFLATKSEKMN